MKVLHPKHQYARLPVTETVLYYLFMTQLHSPGWVWGIYFTVAAISWIGAIYLICVQTFFVPKEFE